MLKSHPEAAAIVRHTYQHLLPGLSVEAAHRFADLIKSVDDGQSHSTAKTPAHHPCKRQAAELTSTGPVDKPGKSLRSPKTRNARNAMFPGISISGGGRI